MKAKLIYKVTEITTDSRMFEGENVEIGSDGVTIGVSVNDKNILFINKSNFISFEYL